MSWTAEEKIIVGVNEFIEEEREPDIPHPPDLPRGGGGPSGQRIAEVRASRNGAEVRKARWRRCQRCALRMANLMPPLLACASAYVTLGEMCQDLAAVFGVYEEAARSFERRCTYSNHEMPTTMTRSRVAVLKTTPATVLQDYQRLAELAGMPAP